MPSMTFDLRHLLCQKKKNIIFIALVIFVIFKSAQFFARTGMTFRHPRNVPAHGNGNEGVEQWPTVYTFDHRFSYNKRAADKQKLVSVAVGLAITSKGHKIRRRSLLDSVWNLQFFRTLLPSFCHTASLGYAYSFFIAYDKNDQYFASMHVHDMFVHLFVKTVNQLCPKDIQTGLTLVRCIHDNKPAWAQNDAMMEAYLEHFDYYYRINDDTLMHSINWTDAFVGQLLEFDPPNIGIVGPKHFGGNTKILTYDFVHRSHIDALGFYYPRTFYDLYADTWISQVYGENRTRKMSEVTLTHTQAAGKRYDERTGGAYQLRYMARQVARDRSTLQRFLLPKNEKKLKKASAGKIVCISLELASPSKVFTAITKLITLQNEYSGWKVRIYHPLDKSLHQRNQSDYIWRKILHKLEKLGVEKHFVNDSKFIREVPRSYWPYLAANDNSVDVFIARDLMAKKDYYQVHQIQSWLSTHSRGLPLFCVRDIHRKANLNPSIILGWDMSSLRTMQLQNIMNMRFDILEGTFVDAAVYIPYKKLCYFPV